MALGILPRDEQNMGLDIFKGNRLDMALLSFPYFSAILIMTRHVHTVSLNIRLFFKLIRSKCFETFYGQKRFSFLDLWKRSRRHVFQLFEY